MIVALPVIAFSCVTAVCIHPIFSFIGITTLIIVIVNYIESTTKLHSMQHRKHTKRFHSNVRKGFNELDKRIAHLTTHTDNGIHSVDYESDPDDDTVMETGDRHRDEIKSKSFASTYRTSISAASATKCKNSKENPDEKPNKKLGTTHNDRVQVITRNTGLTLPPSKQQHTTSNSGSAQEKPKKEFPTLQFKDSEAVSDLLMSRYKTPNWRDFYTVHMKSIQQTTLKDHDSQGNKDPNMRYL